MRGKPPKKPKRRRRRPRRKPLDLPSGPEKKFMTLNKKYELGFSYVGNGKRVVGGYNPDFINEEKRMIVEILGDFYHLQKRNRRKDFRRFKKYRALGWRTVFIWASDLDRREEQVLMWFMLPKDLNM